MNFVLEHTRQKVNCTFLFEQNFRLHSFGCYKFVGKYLNCDISMLWNCPKQNIMVLFNYDLMQICTLDFTSNCNHYLSCNNIGIRTFISNVYGRYNHTKFISNFIEFHNNKLGSNI